MHGLQSEMRAKTAPLAAVEAAPTAQTRRPLSQQPPLACLQALHMERRLDAEARTALDAAVSAQTRHPLTPQPPGQQVDVGKLAHAAAVPQLANLRKALHGNASPHQRSMPHPIRGHSASPPATLGIFKMMKFPDDTVATAARLRSHARAADILCTLRTQPAECRTVVTPKVR